MRQLLFLACSLISIAALASEAPGKSTETKMTAAQVINKNVTARGGLKAWRAVHTLTMSGRVEAGGANNESLPFSMKMKRPYMSRLEINFQGKTAMQVYNGEQGWKVRPFLGRDEVESFTLAQAKAARDWQELDGPLIDYISKGTKVKLQGSEILEGYRAYKLLLTLKNGDQRHVWIDATSYLERKIDGEPRMLDGKLHNVSIIYSDYKKEKGLNIPHVIETVVEGSKQPHSMYIDHVAINQSMENALFSKPQLASVMHATMQQTK